MIVGDWVRRNRGRWHEVESVVAGDAVTQCGRRMAGTLDGSALEVSAVQPLTPDDRSAAALQAVRVVEAMDG